MNPEQKCPRCGQPLPSDAPAGHCPKCLVHVAMEAAAMETSVPTITDISQSARLQPSPVPTVRVKYFGDYELVEEIARGGMGVVWKARQVSLNRPVALKMILAGKLASEADVKRFHTEAEAAANLQHPNIVAIHEVGEHEGQHYFSMDYVEGKNLAELVREGPLPAAKAATLVKTIAEAIHYAHQRGTLHRDLKPANVLMDASGQPRITDFGLAKRFGVPPLGGSGGRIPAEAGTSSELTQTGAVMGSPSYMSPEQAAAKHDLVGPTSDVYSIGAMLYHLMTGRAPFVGETPAATLRKTMEEEPVAPSKLNPKTPPDLETICLKCLEKRTERRYHSARELAEELGRFLNQEPIFARQASASRKAWSWLVRNPWAITGAAATIIIGLIGLAYGLLEQNRFLVWNQAQMASPEIRLSAPPWPYERWPAGLRFASMLLMFASFWAAPISFFYFVQRKRRSLPIQSHHSWIYGSSGILGGVLGVVLAHAAIRNYVWKQMTMSWALVILLGLVLPIAWYSALLLWHLVRHFQQAAFAREFPDEQVLFPPTPQTSASPYLSTVAQRREVNRLWFALLLVVATSMLLWVNFPPRLFSVVATFLGLGLIPHLLAPYPKERSAHRHSVGFMRYLLLGLFGLMFLPLLEAARNTLGLRQASLIGLGLGLVGGYVLFRLTRRDHANEIDGRMVETANLPWVSAHPKLFWRAYGLLNLTMWFGFSVVSWAPFEIRLLLPILGFISFTQPYDLTCWCRAKSAERRGRGWTLALSLTTTTIILLTHPLEYCLKAMLIGFLVGGIWLGVILLLGRPRPNRVPLPRAKLN